jgi:hypothetical protein
MATIEAYSIAERVRRGEVVLIRDAERELDPPGAPAIGASSRAAADRSSPCR